MINTIGISKEKMQILLQGKSIYVSRILNHTDAGNYIINGNELILDEMMYPLNSKVLLQDGSLDFATVAKVIDIRKNEIQLHLSKKLNSAQEIASFLCVGLNNHGI